MKALLKASFLLATLTMLLSACSIFLDGEGGDGAPCNADEDCNDGLECVRLEDEDGPWFECHGGPPNCGDGILQENEGEECDPGQATFPSCQDMGYDHGGSTELPCDETTCRIIIEDCFCCTDNPEFLSFEGRVLQCDPLAGMQSFIAQGVVEIIPIDQVENLNEGQPAFGEEFNQSDLDDHFKSDCKQLNPHQVAVLNLVELKEGEVTLPFIHSVSIQYPMTPGMPHRCIHQGNLWAITDGESAMFHDSLVIFDGLVAGIVMNEEGLPVGGVRVAAFLDENAQNVIYAKGSSTNCDFNVLEDSTSSDGVFLFSRTDWNGDYLSRRLVVLNGETELPSNDIHTVFLPETINFVTIRIYNHQ
ncbi:MAG: hypothetical protein JRF33_13000 [Deltaproteobacteria bacterium]|nr:hypothetical protein [Deltaproteobacteria bacterium]